MRRKDPERMLTSSRKLGRRGLPPARAKDGRLTFEQGGLPCPSCGGGTATVDSRPRPAGIKRRRCCVICGLRFTTWEIIGDNPQIAKISYQTLAHELRQLTERFERLAAMSGETDDDEKAA